MHMGIAFINKKTKREIHRFLIIVGVPVFYAHRYGHSRGQHCVVQLWVLCHSVCECITQVVCGEALTEYHWKVPVVCTWSFHHAYEIPRMLTTSIVAQRSLIQDQKMHYNNQNTYELTHLHSFIVEENCMVRYTHACTHIDTYLSRIHIHLHQYTHI